MNTIIYILLSLITFQISVSQTSGNNGTITGQVSLEGEVPPVPQLIVHKDTHCCGSTTPSPRLSVGKENGLKDAVVYLEDVRGGKPFDLSEPVLLDQKECHFEPHVVIVPFGGQLVIRNSDEVLHNVRVYNIEDGRTIFNIAQPIQGQQTSIRPALFDRPGIYHATCDAGHPWMSAFIIVAKHPYYTITDENGNFTLEDVPPGRYRLHVWHGGVHIQDTRMSAGDIVGYIYEDPYLKTNEIEMETKAVKTIDIKLKLR